MYKIATHPSSAAIFFNAAIVELILLRVSTLFSSTFSELTDSGSGRKVRLETDCASYRAFRTFRTSGCSDKFPEPFLAPPCESPLLCSRASAVMNACLCIIPNFGLHLFARQVQAITEREGQYTLFDL